jgi:hypothetical protein
VDLDALDAFTDDFMAMPPQEKDVPHDPDRDSTRVTLVSKGFAKE